MDAAPESRPEHDSHVGDVVPIEGDETSAPRRAASAEFVVQSEVGSEALLREAMDPANQSLREALRLSFRVLQVVILVLIVLFIFSGFQTVEDGQSGVMLRWGKILSRDGEQALGPGLKFSKWPYPAGEFVLFRDVDRRAGTGAAFWPRLASGQTLEDAIQDSTVRDPIVPGRDGSLLVSGGDLAHLRLDAMYDVVDPVRFVHCVEDRSEASGRLDAERLVRLALQRAAVHTAARMSLQEFVELSDDRRDEIRGLAQAIVSRPEIDSGIRIRNVQTPEDPTPAFAIKRTFGELQEARFRADEVVTGARTEAEETLIAAAGARYQDVIDAIRAYEESSARHGEESSEARARIDALYALLESDRTSGEVADILNYARNHRTMIETTLGHEARRFNSILPAYREHPSLVVERLWMETFGRVMMREDAEIIFGPEDIGSLKLALAGQDHIRQLRRKLALERQERGDVVRGLDLETPFFKSAAERGGGPGRRLDRDARGLGGDRRR